MHVFITKRVQPSFSIGSVFWVLVLALFVATTLQAQGLVPMIRSALAQDPIIKSHVALEAASAAQVESAEWQFYPTPSIAIQSAVSGFDSNVSHRVITLSVQQPLWNGGRLQAGVDEANADLSLQANTTQAKRWDMAQAVVQAYGKWWVAHHQRLSWDEGLKVHEKFVQQVGRRVDIGVSAIIDLGLAEGRLSATLAERNLALAQEQIALDDLKFLTKIDSLNLTAEAQLPAVSLEFVAYNRLLDAALSNSISLKQAKARAEKAEAEQDAQQASIWPQLYLQAERQIGNFSQTNVNNDTTVFVVFSSQLNAGLSFQSNNEASEATYTAALEQVNGEEQNVARQLRSSLTLIASFNKRQIALNAARGKSKQVYQSFNRQFTEGLKDWQELLNSARELVQSDVQWAQTYGQYLVASWQLQLDTQGLSFLAEGT